MWLIVVSKLGISLIKALKITKFERFSRPCQQNSKGLCSWALLETLQYPKRQLHWQPHLRHPKTIFKNCPCFPKYSITISKRSVDITGKLQLIGKCFMSSLTASKHPLYMYIMYIYIYIYIIYIIYNTYIWYKYKYIFYTYMFQKGENK